MKTRFAVTISSVAVLALGAFGWFGYTHRCAASGDQLSGTTSSAPDLNPASNSTYKQGSSISALPIVSGVTVADLKDLAAMVHLNDGGAGEPDKARWSEALPKAQKLLHCACDCETRNWLNNFIQTGNYVLSGSNEYQTSVKFLASLPRNDDEGTTHQVAN